MRKTTAVWAGALAALAFAASARAHHSGSMYVTTAVWVSGTVVRFERVNPHTITILEERSADGQIRRWAVEGPPQSRLDRSLIDSIVPKVGDTIEFWRIGNSTCLFRSAECTERALCQLENRTDDGWWLDRSLPCRSNEVLNLRV